MPIFKRFMIDKNNGKIYFFLSDIDKLLMDNYNTSRIKSKKDKLIKSLEMFLIDKITTDDMILLKKYISSI